MGMIKGIKLEFFEPVTSGVDPFGQPIVSATNVYVVENVLVSPVSFVETKDTTDLKGVLYSAQLAIPKGERVPIPGTKVHLFGEIWTVIDGVEEGLEHLIPLDWHKKVKVERFVRSQG